LLGERGFAIHFEFESRLAAGALTRAKTLAQFEADGSRPASPPAAR
jgi:hypothetical protein